MCWEIACNRKISLTKGNNTGSMTVSWHHPFKLAHMWHFNKYLISNLYIQHLNAQMSHILQVVCMNADDIVTGKFTKYPLKYVSLWLCLVVVEIYKISLPGCGWDFTHILQDDFAGTGTSTILLLWSVNSKTTLGALQYRISVRNSSSPNSCEISLAHNFSFSY